MATESFPTDPSGLPEAGRPELLELADGDTLDLRVGPVAKRLGDTTVRMLGYNGSIPGPTLKVQQGSEIIVHVTNQGDLDTTVHWHGLRLENKYDGVPHETQAPIPVGGEFTYRIQFPDAGLYWYHPHIREDYTQELGLYGNILVVPTDPDYWPPADRDLVLTVDDLLVEDGKIAPFSPTETSYAAMGRFGNVFLTSGEPDLRLEARVGEVVRLWLTNTANTRVFNLAVPGARMKLVGGDSGRVEHEEFIEGGGAGALGAGGGRRAGRPAGRAAPGAPHPGPDLPAGHDHGERGAGGAVAGGAGVRGAAPGPGAGGRAQAAGPLAGRAAGQGPGPGRPDGRPGRPASRRGAGDLRLPDASRGHQRRARPLPQVRHEAAGHPGTRGDDLCLSHASGGHQRPAGPLPQVRHEAARNRGTGDQLCLPDASGGHQRPAGALPQVRDEAARGRVGPPAGGSRMIPPRWTHHGGHAADHDHGGRRGPRHGSADGIEWEDDMVEVNRLTTTATMHWKFLDRTSGADSPAIDWQFTVGERVKIRLVNEMDSDHPMHHPFHLHGAGRFLVLARDGVAEPNLVWKDTVLVRTGQVVDILFDVTNPGLWMAHCHIAEHMQSGMMFSFNVARDQAVAP